MIKNVTDFGAFVDLGGVDGLIHISEMSWGRIDNPKKNLHVGDTLTVLVKDIHDTKVALEFELPGDKPVGECFRELCSRYSDHRQSCTYDRFRCIC